MENGENLHDDNDQLEENTTESKPNVLHLLKYSWDRINRMERVKSLRKVLNESPLVDTVDLDGITAKMSSYTTLNEYLADIQGFVHSCSVRFAGNGPVLRAIKSFSENCHRDVNSIRKCSECFNAWTKDRYNYFTRACSKPHLLVFAKTPANPFWPAKVMLINGKMVNVEFFGDHTQADIPAEDCFLYSERLPGRNTKKDEFITAKKELNEHIGNIKKKFGKFKPAGYRCVLNPFNYKGQLHAMIPDAFVDDTSLDNGYEYRAEWAEVHRDCDFDDSIVEVIGSSMGMVHESPASGDGQSLSGHSRTVKAKHGEKRHAKEGQGTRTPDEKHQAKDVRVKELRREEHRPKERVTTKGQAEENRSNQSQLNGHQEGQATDLGLPNGKQSAIGRKSNVNTRGHDVHQESTSSAESETPRRARKTFPGPMPKLGQSKKSSQMHRDTTARKIAKLEIERDQLLLQNHAYEQEILKLNEQLQKNDHCTVCASCGKGLDELYFCNKDCQLSFD
ncbi:uncharacterized protein LOC129570556 [Sitodiplosis mosellana]|uniref:uncharacterized protein LOC129570556 n=1 Tax=Sitodiplosis mosellana TaxID=263140 RepID=UPI002444BE62|nr:uncharacterized protein LOC129570556 [Sitodiplosis mosellana]